MTTWTSDQQKVIDTRDNNILVSAAAGSGKTAVLVERIINKIIIDKVEVDKLLVVTFTNAAAREMKERIRKALDDAIRNEPSNEFLIRQKTIITNADICTIDSFCGKLVRDNYNDIGVDPSFRLCDESEQTLLFREAFDNVLDNNFAADDNNAFINLIKLYSDSLDYSSIYRIVEGLYMRACSYPWPKKWLSDISKPYMIDEGITLTDIDWICEMYNEIIDSLNSIKEDLISFQDKISSHLVPDKKGNNKIKTNIEKGLSYIETLTSTDTIEELYNKLNDVGKLSKGESTFVKATDYNPDDDNTHILYVRYALMCDSYNELYASLLDGKADNILEEINYVSEYALTLISLTFQVIDEFDLIKAEQNVATFNDVEHFALNILLDPNTKKPTDTAMSIKKNYDEVMVDEYQDVNELQERILSTLSNGHNMFMVGDVKQSIYGFRMAQPDIFVNKANVFGVDEQAGVLINLKKNFRSRREVLDIVNDIFAHIMTKRTCGYEYDDDAKLYFGAEESYDDGIGMLPEIIIADSNEDDFENAKEVEANIVADRIKELFDTHFQVKDKDKDGNVVTRNIKYSDIAIILRAVNTNGRVYEEALLNNNVPVYTSVTHGYFDTVEVKLVLSFLSVIDNPCHDIELMSVLHSPIYNISNDTFAKIRIHNEDTRTNDYLYYDIKEYLDKLEDDEECHETDRLKLAMNTIDELRNAVFDTPIHELIQMIYDRTSYLDYVSALVNGQYRRANLLALIDKAIDYEKTNFRGVFRFLRYIEAMREYDLDVGEASISSDNDDVVRILTMHKSKGLEFPVVFVCDLGGSMKDMDLNDSNIIHNTLGIGMELRREIQGNRYKKDTQYKRYIKQVKRNDYLAEEARLLYVAATRAKEKLILTATLKEPVDKINSFMIGSLTYNNVINAKSRIEWIVRGINTTNPDLLSLIIEYRTPPTQTEKDIVNISDIQDKLNVLNERLNTVSDEMIDYIQERFAYEYPYVIDDNIKTKYSVSEIKHDAIIKAFEEVLDAQPEFLEEEKKSIVPKFIAKEEEEVNRGALYGTAMHRVMECIDFISEDYGHLVDKQIEGMLQSNLITKEQYELVNINKITSFMSSDIAMRMHEAAMSDNLWIEQPFVFQESPKKLLNTKVDSIDNVLIQGIIDVFFIEEGGIVLLDYKTDKIDSDNELITRYKTQIDLYAKALENAFNMKVKEKLLYSFSLDKIVDID